MSIFKAIKNFFTGVSVETPTAPERETPPSLGMLPEVKLKPKAAWPFPSVRPEDTTETSEVAIKPAANKKRPAKIKAEAPSAPMAQTKATPKSKPAVIKATPVPVKAAPVASTSRRVRKTKPTA